MPFSGELLKEARAEAEMTLQRLAEQIGVDRVTVMNYQSGRSAPPADRLERIAEVLGKPIDFFFAPKRSLVTNGRKARR